VAVFQNKWTQPSSSCAENDVNSTGGLGEGLIKTFANNEGEAASKRKNVGLFILLPLLIFIERKVKLCDAQTPFFV
jgi:hypothetical protein